MIILEAVTNRSPIRDSSVNKMTLYWNEMLLQMAMINLIFLEPGIGLNCYFCHTGTNPSCEDASDVPEMDCVNYFLSIGVGFILRPTTYACQKLQVKDLNGQLITLRQCVFVEEENRTTCDLEHDRLLEMNYTLEYCGLCKSDLCNTSSKSYTSPTVAFYIAVINIWGTIIW